MSQAPAVREMPDQAAPALRTENTLSNEQIRYIANTEIVPKHLRGKPDAMIAVILKGRALGLDDIHSLTAVNFIEGKPTLAAETMVTLVRRRGHSIMWDAKTGESCTVTGKRSDTGDEGSVTWTMKMAKDAGLIGKDNWRRYPDTMLFWRAVSQLCRMLFADVLMGASYTEDEAQEAAERGRVTEAVSGLPAVEEAHIRQEPVAGPSEAQLNRLARLEERSGDAYKVVLRGVFGVEMSSQLDASAATQYEAMLTQALPPEDSAEGPHEGTPSDEDERGGSSPDGDEKSDSSPSAELPDEPAPEVDEVVNGEIVEETDERLIEIAGETEIPIGSYRGKTLAEIHDGWIKYGLENTGKLPDAFVEALELWARERKPEIWQQVRG
ncbi:MAG: hypothetical protein K0S82_21 [Gaiellaceae bacterium]|jgi:hypothetical protein|nr:hypothetical protein [Gaiellaceae bacterium]